MMRLAEAVKTATSVSGSMGKPRSAWDIPRKNRGGDCFEAAGKYFMDHREDKNLVLVHGEVSGQGPLEGIKFAHGWVEKGNTVIDKSNGKDLKIDKGLYYAIGQIEKVIKYSWEDFQKKVAKYGTWGPWDLKTEF